MPTRSNVFSFFGNAVEQRNNLIPNSSNALIECNPTCSPHAGTFMMFSP
ncbi:MAG: hypothetical protein ACR2F1_00215 [Nitrososphaeraceae archaeon]